MFFEPLCTFFRYISIISTIFTNFINLSNSKTSNTYKNFVLQISTSYELTQQYNVFMIFQLASEQSWIISHSRKLKTFESPSPMDSRTLSRWYETQNLHLLWTSLFLMNITIDIFLNHHLPWTPPVSSNGYKEFNLHLSWTVQPWENVDVWFSTSHGPPYYGQKVRYVESTPPTTSYGLLTLLIIVTSSINISWNLHLPWTSTVSRHNSVFFDDLHLSWTTTLLKADYIWISTFHGLLYTLT